MINKTKKSFLYNNSLSIAFLVLAVITIVAQIITGLHQYNDFLTEQHQTLVTFLQYFKSGHFIEATFENWESEFLQMALFVWLTVFLRQKGSSESKQRLNYISGCNFKAVFCIYFESLTKRSFVKNTWRLMIT